MRLRVIAFASLRELLGNRELELELAERATVEDAWRNLARRFPELEPLRASTRLACNGALTAPDRTLADGDELALLPPVGGG